MDDGEKLQTNVCRGLRVLACVNTCVSLNKQYTVRHIGSDTQMTMVENPPKETNKKNMDRGFISLLWR